MYIGRHVAILAAFFATSALPAENLMVSVDVSAAKAVLEAVGNPNLSEADALKIAHMPGNQGLIRKAKSYGRTADDVLFAKALVATARHDSAYVDVSKFNFAEVQDHAAQTEQALAALTDPQRDFLQTVKARIANMTPDMTGQVKGYLVVGGTSGGFAFGDPEFFLDLDRYPSAPLASTIMEHELFHAVQGIAHAASKATPSQEKCVKGMSHAEDIADFFESLSAEGTATYAGNLLALPKLGIDEATMRERGKFARNVDMVGRSVTQLELSVHGLSTGAAVTPQEVYALGFYGDEVMYSIGYVMARAIAKEQGDAAIGKIIKQPGSQFVERYIHLKGYGKSEDMPALKPATIRWADRLSACYSGK